MNKKQKEEVKALSELLVAVLEEEGYTIPFAKYADSKMIGFDLPLRSGGKVLVQISWL